MREGLEPTIRWLLVHMYEMENKRQAPAKGSAHEQVSKKDRPRLAASKRGL